MHKEYRVCGFCIQLAQGCENRWTRDNIAFWGTPKSMYVDIIDIVTFPIMRIRNSKKDVLQLCKQRVKTKVYIVAKPYVVSGCLVTNYLAQIHPLYVFCWSYNQIKHDFAWLSTYCPQVSATKVNGTNKNLTLSFLGVIIQNDTIPCLLVHVC